MPLTLTAGVVLSGHTLTVRPVTASFAGRPINPAGPRITEALTAQERQLPDLPMGMEPTGVCVSDGGTTVRAEAEHADVGH